MDSANPVAVSAATVEWCEARQHPYVTYNPHLNRTYCRCGARQHDGDHPVDWDAMWEIFHDHPPGDRCRCYLPDHACATLKHA